MTILMITITGNASRTITTTCNSNKPGTKDKYSQPSQTTPKI